MHDYILGFSGPAITSISPPTAAVGGGTLLTVQGANFGSRTDTTQPYGNVVKYSSLTMTFSGRNTAGQQTATPTAPATQLRCAIDLTTWTATQFMCTAPTLTGGVTSFAPQVYVNFDNNLGTVFGANAWTYNFPGNVWAISPAPTNLGFQYAAPAITALNPATVATAGSMFVFFIFH